MLTQIVAEVKKFLPQKVLTTQKTCAIKKMPQDVAVYKGVSTMLSGIEIGNKLRELRGNTPRSVMAEAVGVSTSALQMYECGDRIPRDDVKEAIAHYFGLTVGALFFNE